MMSPRPILKRSATYASPNTHATPLAVHFPPSPSLTTHTFSVYSSSAYDRSPIIVTPNSCALPERGCPGRTYTLDDPGSPPSPSSVPKRGHPYGGRDLHPRAIALNVTRQQQLPDAAADETCSLPPPLIPDLSSESDESDGFMSPPLESYLLQSSHIHGLAIPTSRNDKFTSYGDDATSPTALSFLPYPSSPPTHSPYSYPHSPDDPQKPRRRRDKKHECSRDPDRIRNVVNEVPECSTPTKSRKGKISALNRSLSAYPATSYFSIEDDGCLGGF